MPAEALIDRLRRRERIAEPTAVVVAHPDDETIGAGASLRLFDDLTVVHVTDGAPRRGGDAEAAGHASASAYAAARRAELADALAAGRCRAPCLELGVPDQAASDRMAAVADRLAVIFTERGVRAVLTHPYEGGHPDHDATAFAAHLAAGRARPPPALVEMAGYHAGADGGVVTSRFLPGDPAPTVVALDEAERAAKGAMLRCFRSQQATLAIFGCEAECFRPAPRYDFGRPPHPGTLHYERHDWGMTGARWRALAAATA